MYVWTTKCTRLGSMVGWEIQSQFLTFLMFRIDNNVFFFFSPKSFYPNLLLENKCILLPFSPPNLTVFFFCFFGLFFFLQKKQREFEEYIRDKYITAKADFRTLLKETKFITYRCVQWNVPCRQLSLLVLTRLARAYYAFTHMLTLLIFKNKKQPTIIKGQRQPAHLCLTFFFFFFFKKGPRCQFLFCVTHPSTFPLFKTGFYFYFTAFSGVPPTI